ncbi:META domain-containing protein [Nocardia sp. NBC_01009]|uniref:META domain-containing protein n=1 Tax=Nocardia sp. NBC_01009 TaxID=2975996 RepID=UPI00386A50A9|nr:META domain-containing protein [Nocardia sp. NBC_01009]
MRADLLMIDSNLWGHRYVSLSVTEDGRRRYLVRGTRITLWFVAETRRLSAHAGCNTVMFDADIDDGIVKARSPFSTVLTCSAELMQQDRWLSEFLLLTPAWTVVDDALVLTGDHTEIVLQRTPANHD